MRIWYRSHAWRYRNHRELLIYSVKHEPQYTEKRDNLGRLRVLL